MGRSLILIGVLLLVVEGYLCVDTLRSEHPNWFLRIWALPPLVLAPGLILKGLRIQRSERRAETGSGGRS